MKISSVDLQNIIIETILDYSIKEQLNEGWWENRKARKEAIKQQKDDYKKEKQDKKKDLANKMILNLIKYRTKDLVKYIDEKKINIQELFIDHLDMQPDKANEMALSVLINIFDTYVKKNIPASNTETPSQPPQTPPVVSKEEQKPLEKQAEVQKQTEKQEPIVQPAHQVPTEKKTKDFNRYFATEEDFITYNNELKDLKQNKPIKPKDPTDKERRDYEIALIDYKLALHKLNKKYKK